MPITPNTSPQVTTNKNGHLVTVHKRNDSASPSASTKKILRNLPSTPTVYLAPVRNPRAIIEKLSESEVVSVSESFKPKGYDIIAAKINRIERWYLLGKDKFGKEYIAGRVEFFAPSVTSFFDPTIDGGNIYSTLDHETVAESFANLAKQDTAQRRDEVVKKSKETIKALRAGDLTESGARLSFPGRYADAFIDPGTLTFSSRPAYVIGLHGTHDFTDTLVRFADAKKALLELIETDPESSKTS